MEVGIAYDNIEKILTYGFLMARISIKDHDLLIKNITDKEIQNLRSLIGGENSLKFNMYTIAYCLAFIDGKSVLENRHESIPDLVEYLRSLPHALIIKILKAINSVNIDYSKSVSFLEGYSYTQRSRYLWSFFDPYNRSSYLGIRGLDDVGLNSLQENWIAINKRLDEEDTYDKEFNNAILIVSASNGKGAQNLQKNYNSRRRELKELRDEISTYGYDRKREEENDKKRDQWTAPLNSKEDLVRELYRQMSGKKDRHDLYMDKWVENQKRKAEEAKRRVEEKQEEFRVNIESMQLEDVEPSKPISTEDLEKILKKKQEFKFSNKRKVDKELEFKREQSEYVMKKIGQRVIKAD